MTFQARLYPDIVRDLLTNLTGGTIRETTTASLEEDGTASPILLQKRPVRRVSHVEEKRINEDLTEQTVRYTPADYQLVSSTSDELDTLVFRNTKKQPAAGSELTINYYPTETQPVPLTDLNVGSVVRTLMESFSRELAATEMQLDYVYQSGYFATATGASLDKVVALIGLKRYAPGHAQATVQFNRNPALPGKITVATGTVVTDSDGNRYKTTKELVLEPGENSREVLTAGESTATPAVEAGALNRLETLVAGIASVTNPSPALNLSGKETDEALRARAKGALHGVTVGTLSSLKYGLLSIPGINAVTLTEFPNGIPGEVSIDIAYGEDTPEVRQDVDQAIERFKPAGIRVYLAEASSLEVRVSVTLTLAGTGLNENEIPGLKQQVETVIGAYLEDLDPGAKARRSQMSALVLGDNRIVDCDVSLIPAGGTAVSDLTLASNQVIDLITPFDFPLIDSEELPAPVARTITLGALVPYVPVAGVTEADASAALNLAFEQFINTRSPTNIINVDELAAVLRDDTRYGLIRGDIILTVEVGDTFLQLTDGLGSFTPDAADTLTTSTLEFELREGEI